MIIVYTILCIGAVSSFINMCIQYMWFMSYRAEHSRRKNIIRQLNDRRASFVDRVREKYKI